MYDYLDSGRSGITRESFARKFGAFLSAHDFDDRVKTPQMDDLFGIADEHLRELSAMRCLDATPIKKDHRDGEKLMKAVMKRLKEIQLYVETAKEGGSFTASISDVVIGKLKSVEQQLTDEFADRSRDIYRDETMLRAIAVTRKTEQRELTHDLLTYIRLEFPNITENERNILIGATLAGAGQLSGLREDAGPVESIPMKVTRAKGHHKKYYDDPRAERIYPRIIVQRIIENKKRRKKP